MNDTEYMRSRQQPRRASERQLQYMRDLIVSKDYEHPVSQLPAAWQELFHSIEHGNDNVAASDVSKFIDLLKVWHIKVPDTQEPGRIHRPGQEQQVVVHQEHPRPWDYMDARDAKKHMAMGAPADALKDGMYMGPDPNRHIYKVYHTQKNIQVAKRLIIHETKRTEDGDLVNPKGGHVAATFKYEGRAPLRFLKPDMRLSIEAAAEFGKIYGMCCLCGRTLTDELSIHIGIGPICGNREFGGEFKLMIDKAKLVLAAEEPDHYITVGD